MWGRVMFSACGRGMDAKFGFVFLRVCVHNLVFGTQKKEWERAFDWTHPSGRRRPRPGARGFRHRLLLQPSLAAVRGCVERLAARVNLSVQLSVLMQLTEGGRTRESQKS